VDTQILFSVDETAQALHVSRSLLYELIKSGSIRTVKIGALRRIPVQAVHDYVASLS
jgi:excisionase family DNA binding protein